MTYPRTFFRALRSTKGLAAIEFALIAPLLAFTILALADTANFALAATSMQRAERAGIQYFMNGGTDTSAAKTIVTGTWTNPPSGYTVTASKVCRCGNGLSVTCGASCSNGQPSTTNMMITATATVNGVLMSLPESHTEFLRVQ